MHFSLLGPRSAVPASARQRPALDLRGRGALRLPDHAGHPPGRQRVVVAARPRPRTSPAAAARPRVQRGLNTSVRSVSSRKVPILLMYSSRIRLFT